MSNLKFETFILIAKCVTVLITYMWATVVSTDDSIDPLFIFLFIGGFVYSLCLEK